MDCSARPLNVKFISDIGLSSANGIQPMRPRDSTRTGPDPPRMMIKSSRARRSTGPTSRPLASTEPISGKAPVSKGRNAAVCVDRRCKFRSTSFKGTVSPKSPNSSRPPASRVTPLSLTRCVSMSSIQKPACLRRSALLNLNSSKTCQLSGKIHLRMASFAHIPESEISVPSPPARSAIVPLTLNSSDKSSEITRSRSDRRGAATSPESMAFNFRRPRGGGSSFRVFKSWARSCSSPVISKFMPCPSA